MAVLKQMKENVEDCFFFLKNQMETSDYVQYPTTFLVRSTSFEILTLTFIYLLLP